MTRTAADGLRWADQGTALVRRALTNLGSDEQTWLAPSGLPGWSRKHLLSHLNGNATALRNLATWARTGVVTPMYSSPEQRNADIEAGATLPGTDLVSAFDSTAGALSSDWAQLSEDQWTAEVVTAQGRTVAATEVPWLRSREVMVHAVDLDGGIGFADLPADFCAALVDDIVAKRSTGGNPALVIAPDDHDGRWQVGGDGEPVTVTGPLHQVTAWLAGRAHQNVTTTDGGPAPILPPWL